jgi:hypothetical protein
MHEPLKPRTYNGTIRMSIFQSPPYSVFAESDKPLTGNDVFEGYAIDLIKEIAEILSKDEIYTQRPELVILPVINLKEMRFGFIMQNKKSELRRLSHDIWQTSIQFIIKTRLKFLISHNPRGNTVITLKSQSVSHT